MTCMVRCRSLNVSDAPSAEFACYISCGACKAHSACVPYVIGMNWTKLSCFLEVIGAGGLENYTPVYLNVDQSYAVLDY
jgi:hypothetical protein